MSLSYYHFIILIFVLFSCRKPDDIGNDLLYRGQNDSLMIYTDTSTLLYQSILLDSIRTDQTSFKLFGNYKDPQLGRISAIWNARFNLVGENVQFIGDSVRLDTLYLHLYIVARYGKITEPQTLQVYRLLGDIRSDSTYYSNQEIAYDASKELSNNFQLSLPPSFTLTEVVIPLDSTLGNQILYADATTLANNTNFTNFFKGLRITTQPVTGTGAIYSIQSFAVQTRLRLRYRSYVNGVATTKDYNFYPTSEATGFSTIKRTEIAGTLYEQYLQNPNNSQYEILQCGAYIKQYIRIPNLRLLYPIGIHKSEIVLKVDKNLIGPDTLNPPVLLYAYSAAAIDTFSESNLINQSTYDATNGNYVIDITNYTQNIIDGRLENTGLVLVPIANATSVNRALIFNSNAPNPANRPKLRLTYTKLPSN
ncbi:MAG: DUF4270 domain-containing protein [Bacteroidia bacterium]|nr:DUF4270 domain-containing protein [Bacteroidia bacterium]